jgi:hypothetical protein
MVPLMHLPCVHVSVLFCMQRIEHLFLMPGLMSGTFFSQHMVLFLSQLLRAIRQRGGPMLVAYGDLFSVFLIAIRLEC